MNVIPTLRYIFEVIMFFSATNVSTLKNPIALRQSVNENSAETVTLIAGLFLCPNIL
jgi:hypothetical protein